MSDSDKVVISFTFYLLHLTVTGVMISLVQHILEWVRRSEEGCGVIRVVVSEEGVS